MKVLNRTRVGTELIYLDEEIDIDNPQKRQTLCDLLGINGNFQFISVKHICSINVAQYVYEVKYEIQS